MTLLDVSESVAAWIYSVSSVAVIAFGILAYWASGKLDTFTDSRIADNERLTAVAQKGLAQANLEIELQKTKNLKLLQEIENEKHGGAEMLAAMSPRNLQWSDLAGKFTEPLSGFGSQRIVIEYLPEAEPKRAAHSLAQELQAAGWDVVDPAPNEALWSAVHAGVRVEPYNVPSRDSFKSANEFDEHLNAMWKSGRAADCLIVFLKSRRWQGVRPGWQEEGELPAGTVRIRIGTKAEPQIPRALMPGLDDWYAQHLIDNGEPVAGPVPLERTEQRSISKEQHDLAKQVLVVKRESYDRRFGKLIPVEIRCPSDNNEALQYAEQFAALLTESGWEVAGGNVVVDTGFNRRLTGVAVRADSTSSGQDFFERGSLYWAFTKAGIEVRDLMLQPTFQPPQILIGW